MRRFLTGKDSVRGTFADDLRPLGAARIAVGTLILFRTTPLLAPFDVLFLRDAIPLLDWPRDGFSFAWLPLDAIRALCVLRTVAAVALTLGVWPSRSGVACGVCGYLAAAQSAFGVPATLQLLYQGALLLGLSDASAALAIAPSPIRSPRSSYLLLRAFVASVYVWAGFFKLRSSWLDGRTLLLLHDSGAIHGALADWLLATPTSRALVARGVALFELSAAPLLFWPRTRFLALGFAYAFHAGLELTAHPDFLGWGMMALLSCFWEPRQEPAPPTIK